MHGVGGVSKIDWSMDGVEWLDGVGVAGTVDPSLNVVNMSGSTLVVVRLKSGDHTVAVVYRLIRQRSTTLDLNVGTSV